MKIKTKIYLLIFAIILPVVLFGCAKEKKEQFVVINEKKIKIEVADSLEEQVRGLSDHKPLTEDEGMLFLFSDKLKRNFWMRRMNFNIDIIWLDNDKVVRIDKNLLAEGENPKKTYPSVSPVNLVLELNAGWSDKNNLKVGDKINYSL